MRNIEQFNVYEDFWDLLGPIDPLKLSQVAEAQAKSRNYFLQQTCKKADSVKDSVRGLLLEVQNILVEVYKTTKEWKRYPIDSNYPQDVRIKRVYGLVRAIDSEIEYAISNMYRSSLRRFELLLEYLSLGLTIDRDKKEIFDHQLSPVIFTLKHKAMSTYSMIPVDLEFCTPLNRLKQLQRPPLIRRAIQIARTLLYIESSMQQDRFKCESIFKKLSTNITLNPMSFKYNPNKKTGRSLKSSLWISRMSSSTNPTQGTASKNKQNVVSRSSMREYCRMRLYHMQEYLSEHWEDYIQSLMNNYKVPLNTDLFGLLGISEKEQSKDVPALETTNVTSNILKEFLIDSNFFDIQPPLPRLESSLKSNFLSPLLHMQTYDKLQVLEIVRDNQKFDFSDLTNPILSTMKLFDEFLAEAFLPLMAVSFFLQSFEHLIVTDEKKLVEEEVNLLEKQNSFAALEEEVRQLKHDQTYVENIPEVMWLGLFEIDLKEFKTGVLSKLTKALEEVFVTTIYNKFLELLESNKVEFEYLVVNLITPIDTVDNFIKQKEFLSGTDFEDHLEGISRDLKLTKSLFEFQLEFLRWIDKPDADKYLKSLSYLKELEFLRQDAIHRLGDSGPKFITELKNDGKFVFEELEKIQKEIKCFPYYCDIESGDIYNEKTLEINKQLDVLVSKAQDINRKQRVLDSKLTDFNLIDNEIKNFSKYSQLWEFVAFKWSPVVERWWKGSFQDLNKFEMSNTLNYGSELLKKLYDEFNDSPKIQEIIKSKQTDIERHQNIFSHITILKDASFKERHWEAFFHEVKQEDKGSTLLHSKIDLKKLTLNDLMEMHLTSHTNFLKQILIKARAEAVIEQSIKETRENIRKITIKPRVFDSDQNGIMVIPNIGGVLTLLEEYLSTCDTMLANPEYPEEFKRELRSLVRLVGFTVEIIRLLQRVQLKLIKFAPVFKFRDLTRYISRSDIVHVFARIRQEYMEVMRSIHLKEMGYFVVLVGDDNDDTKANEVIKKLRDMNRQCEEILDALNSFFRVVRVECPRYYFFSNEQMLLLCSLLKFPKSLFGLIVTLFKGIASVELSGNSNDLADADQLSINRMRTKNNEIITIPVPPNIDLSPTGQMPFISIITAIERSIKRYMQNTRHQHIWNIAKLDLDFVSILKYCRDNQIILQNCRLYTKLLFDFELATIYRLDPTRIKERLGSLKAKVRHNYNQLYDYPSRSLHGNYSNKVVVTYWTNLLMLARQLEETVDYLERFQAFEPTCFKFQSLPKYSVLLPTNSTDQVALKSRVSEYLIALEEATPDDVRQEQLDQATKKEPATDALAKPSPSGLDSGSGQFAKDLFSNEKHKVTLTMLDYSMEYCDEVLADSQTLAEFPIIEKRLFYLLTSVANNNFVMVKGANGLGKNHSIRALSQMLAKNHYEYECDANPTSLQIPSYIVGALNGGYWLTFKRLDSCPTPVLSVILTYLDAVKNSITSSGKKSIDNFALKPHPSFAIFATYRLGPPNTSHKFTELPINLLELFRVVRVSSPCLITITSSLISSITSASDSLEWAAKLSYFVKTYSKTDLQEAVFQQTDEKNPVPKLQDTNSSRLTKPALTLKVIATLIGQTIAKVVSFTGKQYDKFRDSESGKFRIDINKIKVLPDKDRRAIFTKIFIDLLVEYFGRAGQSKSSLGSVSELLSKIFQPELETLKNFNQAGLNPPIDRKLRDKLQAYVGEYREHNKDMRTVNVQKFLTKAEPYLSVMLDLESEKSTHYLVYGQPDSQKSLLIDVMAFVWSEACNVNFRKFWLLIENYSLETLIGDNTTDGMLGEILNQSHVLDLEDKTNQAKKINYLFQTNSDLFCTLADSREQKKMKTGSNSVISGKEMSRGHNWVVVDANSGKNDPKSALVVEKIFSTFSALYSFKDVNKHVGFSANTKLFYELSNASMLNASLLTDLKLIYLEKPLFDLKDKIGMWLDKLGQQDMWFQMVCPRLQELLKSLVIPFVDVLDNISKKNPELLTYETSAASMLGSVLNMLSIFLNEFRKYHVIHEFDVLKTKPDLFAACKAEGQHSPTRNGSVSAWKILGNLNNQMKLAQSAQSFSRIQSRASGLSPGLAGKAGGSPNNNHYLSGVESADQIETWETRRLESLLVMATLYSLNSFVLEQRRSQMISVFDEGISRYIKKNKIRNTEFACGYLSLSAVTKKGMCQTEFCFDITKGCWVRWLDLKFRTISEISSSYSNRNFSRVELERLSCQNNRLLNFTDPTETTNPLETFVGLRERNLYLGSEGNMLTYFSELFISYGVSFVLVSDQQQGKTTYLSSILRKLIEQNRIVTFNYQMDKRTSTSQVQGRIEESYMKEVGNVLRPSKNRIAVVWLDDVHLSSTFCKPESYMRSLQVQNGWFSLASRNFYKVLNTVFLLTASIKEEDSFASRQVMSSINKDILAKSPVLKMRRMTKEEFSTIFFQIVDSQIVSTPTSSKKAEEALTASIVKRFISVLFDSRLEIAEMTNFRPLRLGYENFFQTARTLNNISWKDVNNDKRSAQWVWIWVLRDLFAQEIGMHRCELKNLLSGGDWTPSPELRARELKTAKSKISPKMNPGLFLTDRRSSDQNLMLDIKEDGVVKRLRAGSAAVELEGEVDQPVSPFTIRTQQKRRLKRMQDEIMSSEKESEGEENEFFFKQGSEKMQISPLPQPSRFKKLALQMNSNHSSEKSIRLQGIANKNFSQDDIDDSQSLEQLSVPRNSNFPIVIDPKNQKDDESVSQSHQSDLEPSIAENSELSQQPADSSPARGKSKFFEAAVSSKPKIQLLSASQKEESQDRLEPAPSRPSFMQSTSKGQAASSRKQSQLFPGVRKSVYGGDSEDELKPLTVRDEESASDSNDSSSGESPEYVFRDPNSQRISAFSFSKRDKKKKKKGQSPEEASKPRASGFLGVSGMDDINASRRGSNARSIQRGEHSQAKNPLLEASDSSESALPMVKLNTKNPENLLDEAVEKILDKITAKQTSLERLKRSVFANRMLFFDTIIHEATMGEELEKDYDLIPRAFEVGSNKNYDVPLGYLKSAIQNYVMHTPEATLSLDLEVNGSAQLLADFTSLHLSIHTEFQHLLVTCLKSSHYVRHLLGLICDCVGNLYFFHDLSQDDIQQTDEQDLTRNIMRSIKHTSKENFDRIVKNNKRLVFVIYFPQCISTQQQAAAQQVLDLISAIIFNTDNLVTLLDEQMFEHVAQIKKHRLSSHYEDFFATYLVRNKLESHVTFVLIHEQNTSGLTSKKSLYLNTNNGCTLPNFLQNGYPKLFTRLKKCLFNGLKLASSLEERKLEIGDPLDAVILPWTGKPIPAVFRKSLILELAYLKQEKAVEGVHCMRGYQETLHTFLYVKHHLLKKVQGKQGDSEHVERDQRLLLDRISRRKEILKIEIDKLQTEETKMKEELSLLSSARVNVDKSIEQLRSDREKLKTLLMNHKEKVDLCRKELEKIPQFDQDLKDAQETILGFQETELQKQLAFGGFFHSPIFTIYAVLFNDLFRMPIEPKLTYSDLIGLGNTGDAKRFTNHAKHLAKLLEDPAKHLLPLVKNPTVDTEKIPAERLLAMYKVVKKMEDEGVIKRFNEGQKLFLIWIDFMIQLKVQESKKPELEQLGQKSQVAYSETVVQIDKHSRLLQDLETSAREQARKRQNHEAALEVLAEKMHQKRDSLAVLTRFLDSLTLAQSLYVKMVSPFLSYGLDRNKTIELVSSYIVFWNKYPSLTKKVLFYCLLKATGTNPEVFNEVAIYEFLNPELPLVAALQSKIPFSQNMLSNVSIMNLAQEALLPYCIVKDPSGTVLKWLEHKFTRFIFVDYYCPNPKTIEQLEVALVNGQPCVVVDPNADLLKIITPIVDWRYKRYSESVLVSRDFPSTPSIEVKFNQKKLVVKDGFRLVILLHRLALEELDPNLLAKCFLVNNEHTDKKACTDMLMEELIVNIEPDKRDACIKGFVETDLRSQIYEKYTDMTAKISLFDFITDDLSSYDFKQIEVLLAEVIKASNQQLSGLSRRKKLLEQADKALTTRNSIFLSDLDRDSKAENFMSSSLTLGIKDYKQLEEKYFALAEKLRVYDISNRKLRAYVGDDLCLPSDLFSYLVTESVSLHRAEIDQLSLRQSVSEDVILSLHNKIERDLFIQLLGNIPDPSRSIFTFLCGIISLILHSQARKPLIKSLYLMMYSEKLLPKENKPISFVSSKLYEKMNRLYQGVKGHFIYSASNLPSLLSVDQNFDHLLLQLKTLEHIDLTDLEQIRKTDNARLQAISAFLAEGREKRTSHFDKFPDASMMFAVGSSKDEQDNTLDMDNSLKLDNSAHESKARTTRNVPTLSHIEPDKQRKDLSRTGDLGQILGPDISPQMRSRVFSRTGLQQTSEKLDGVLAPKTGKVSLSRLSSVDVHLDSYANPETKSPLTGGGKRSMQKQSIPEVQGFALRIKALGFTTDQKIEEEDKDELGGTPSPIQEDGKNQLRPVQTYAPKRSLNTVVAVRSATKGLITKIKEAKQHRTKTFLKRLQDYLSCLLPMLIRLDKVAISAVGEQNWLEFMTFSRSALVGDPQKNILPAVPLPIDVQDTLGRVDTLTLLKYSRPDMMEYLLNNFHSSIRGTSFSEYTIDLGIVSRLENMRRPVLVVYGNTTLSPVTNLSRVAAACSVEFSLIRFDPDIQISQVSKFVEELISKPTWLVFENLQLLPAKSSQEIARFVIAVLQRPKKHPKFKIFLLLQAGNHSFDSLSRNKLVPEWGEYCYKLFIGRNKSIKEELVGLHWQDIYKLNTNTRGQLFQSVDKQTALALTRARSSIWVGDSQDLGTSRQLSSQKMASQPSLDSSLEDPRDRLSQSDPREANIDFLLELLSSPPPTQEQELFSEKYKQRSIYCLKFIYSILRQRAVMVENLVAGRENSIRLYKNDNEIDLFFEGKHSLLT